MIRKGILEREMHALRSIWILNSMLDISILMNIILYQVVRIIIYQCYPLSFVFNFELVYVICNNTICKLPDRDYTAYVCTSQTNHLHLFLLVQIKVIFSLQEIYVQIACLDTGQSCKDNRSIYLKKRDTEFHKSVSRLDKSIRWCCKPTRKGQINQAIWFQCGSLPI